VPASYSGQRGHRPGTTVAGWCSIHRLHLDRRLVRRSDDADGPASVTQQALLLAAQTLVASSYWAAPSGRPFGFDASQKMLDVAT
jgi:hypothetical protein